MAPPSTTWREIIPADEAARFERYAAELRALQKRVARRGPPFRALHAKGQLGLEAELTVLPDLPAHARHGLFAKAAKHKAYVRFSNGAHFVQPDAKPDVRGLAVKVLGVAGKKVIPGMEDAPTQDFLLIQSPSTPFRDPDEFVPFVLAAEKPALLPFRVIANLGLRRGVRLIRAILAGLSAPVPSLATSTYYSAAPIQCGPYAVRYAVFPDAKGDGEAAKTPESLGDELAARLRRGAVAYDLRLQFYVDDARTPIEDASVAWSEADAPFITVARLVLPQQDPSSPRGEKVRAFVERLSFDPWHALVEHKPLGSMMRARSAAYRESTAERGAAREPDGTEVL